MRLSAAQLFVCPAADASSMMQPHAQMGSDMSNVSCMCSVVMVEEVLYSGVVVLGLGFRANPQICIACAVW